MTDSELRDHFAASALPAIIADSTDVDWQYMCNMLSEDSKVPPTAQSRMELFCRYVAFIAYRNADAMLAEGHMLTRDIKP